jgi:hypothetical protein
MMMTMIRGCLCVDSRRIQEEENVDDDADDNSADAIADALADAIKQQPHRIHTCDILVLGCQA